MSVEFSRSTGEWIEKHFAMINENTWPLCKGFKQRLTPEDYHELALNVHLIVETGLDI